MKYSVKFFPEKRKGKTKKVPIRLRVTYSKNTMEYYTGEKCNIDPDEKKSQWDKETCRLKKGWIAPNGQSAKDFNDDLDEIKVAVDALFKLYDATKITPTPDQLRNELKLKLGKEVKKEPESTTEKKGFFERFDQYMNEAPLSPGRAKHMGTTLNKVRSFRPGTQFEGVEGIDSQYLTEFKNYLTNDCNLGNNTMVSELRRLRAFFGWSIEKEWTTNYPFKSFKIGSESYGDPVYITVAERDKLYNAVIEDEGLSIVRDIFVFQCMVGCRVGDLLKLTKSSIINGSVKYIAGKTKDDKPREAVIPLTEKAKAILAKYDLPGGEILPYVPEQIYNENIKKVFKLDSVKLTRMVTVADPKTRKGLQKSIADIASSHMARRVFVGSLHKKGIKNEIIASMSGHVENSKAFARYYKVDEEMQKNAMKEIE